jgi:hypothetical protein
MKLALSESRGALERAYQTARRKKMAGDAIPLVKSHQWENQWQNYREKSTTRK